MKTTRDLLIDASIKVFSEKGYQSATTIEISKEAGVSEMTLFRHFKTKNNLFLTSIKQAMGESLLKDDFINLDGSLLEFSKDLLHEKLLIISKNILLVKMLIRETLSNTLPKELQFTKVISAQVVKRITLYISHNGLNLEANAFAELIVGLLLRYAIMEDNPKYHLWRNKEQENYLLRYLSIIGL